MHIIPSAPQVMADALARHLVDNLRQLSGVFDWSHSYFYHNFPLYKDTEGNNVLADALLVSPDLGVIAFALPSGSFAVGETLTYFEQVPAHIHSRLIRTKALRSGLSTLIPSISAAVVLFGDHHAMQMPTDDFPLITSVDSLRDFLQQHRSNPLSPDVFEQLLATVDGAKGLIRPAPRPRPPETSGSKAKIAYLVESAINDFDIHQKHGMYGALTGPTRIRGIAGSGKTVVLAMKAAMTHLRHPEATILYTFGTKSLYQHVRRLITRFYRQFDDRDPDWDRIHVLHAWGGKTTPGVYYNACQHLGITPLTLRSAAIPALLAKCEPFDFACRAVEEHRHCGPMYDYVLVDEAQDFPASFIRLCHKLAHEGRFVFAYDELQNIFQASVPTIESIFGSEGSETAVRLTDDVILRTCYRNPREILVCSHAVGFGFYGEKIVQILENSEHWESLGYKVLSGDFKEGSRIVVERPEETSLTLVSQNTTLDDIVCAVGFDNVAAEVDYVARSILDDLRDGLKPDDIMVISVDDRNARSYLRDIQSRLAASSVRANNIHEDAGSMKEFWIGGHVTLTTVHKAKGNEAFMVYVIGCDAPMHKPDVRRRNMLFTAMSRAKAWLRVTGVGEEAHNLKAEIDKAKEMFPRISFVNPGPSEIALIRRDIAESMDRKAKMQRVLSELLDLTEDIEREDLIDLLRRQGASKSRRKKFGGTSEE